MKRWIELGRLAALRERERALPRLDEPGLQPRAVAERARALAQLLVQQLGVPQADRPLGPRRAVVVDHVRVDAREQADELGGVRDRRRGEQELRLGAVDAGQPPQPPQDVGDVRAEDAAVDVRLVDHDVAQVREHVAPAVVVRQHAHVEHVRVREDEVRPLADLPALLAGRVAVVDRRPQLREPERRELPRLVLRERLRRVEVERAQLRLAGERVEHGEVEGERLPARRAGRDDQVPARGGRVPGGALVGEELVDPERRERRRARGGWSSSGSGAVRASRAGSEPRYATSSPARSSAHGSGGRRPPVDRRERTRRAPRHRRTVRRHTCRSAVPC